jgi:hypothetical protein
MSFLREINKWHQSYSNKTASGIPPKLRLMLLVSAVKIFQIFLSCQKIFATLPNMEKYERENFFYLAGNKNTVAKSNGTGLTEETGPSAYPQGN